MENENIGRRRWAIAEGYIPEGSHADSPALVSHETACLLNANAEAAHLTITLYTRLDSRQAENALMTTVAYAE